MADKLEICNMALRYLGAEAVSDVTPGIKIKAVKSCNTYFDLCLDQTLRRYRWKCALSRTTLAQDTSTPSFYWDFQYHLPSSPWCLRVLQMENKDDLWTVEGRLLLTNQSSAKILFLKRITELGELDPYATDAIAHLLASKMAVDLRGGDGINLKNDLLTYLENSLIPEAKAASALEELDTDFQKVNPPEWIRRRYQGRTNLRWTAPA